MNRGSLVGGWSNRVVRVTELDKVVLKVRQDGSDREMVEKKVTADP